MSGSSHGTTLRIAQTSALTFACYLIVGIQFATVPEFVAKTLGYGPLVAGIVVSVQYVATLLTRPFAGSLADNKGPKHATRLGLALCLASAVIMIGIAALAPMPAVALGVMVVCRLILGLGESLVATGATLWGFDRAGPQHTARVLAWNGVASYFAIACGAPAGAWLAANAHYGVAVASTLVAIAGVAGAGFIEGTPPKRLPAASIGHAFRDALPLGLALTLGGVGFGMISAFTTLYYADRGWANAGLALTLYGVSLAAVRLVCVNTINRHGGLRVATFCLVAKAAGLLLIAFAPSAIFAKAGAMIAGAGFSLVYPSLGVETVKRTPPEKRGAVLGAFTSFWDLSLGIAGPLGGVVVTLAGFRAVFGVAACVVVCAAGITLWKLKSERHRSPA